MKVSRTIGNGRQTARILLMMLLVLVSSTGIARAQWAKVSGAPNASTCLLLTDGSVMCQAGEESHDWNRLTPDSNGHYETGTWTPLPSFPSIYGPLYYASAVLADGRVIVIGGEYNNGTPSCTGNPGCDVNLGYILDPNSGGPWTALTPPAWGSTVGDAVGVVLVNGTFVIGHLSSTDMAKFNPGTNDFTLLGATGKADNNGEEGWTLLPDGTLLTVDAATEGGTGSQIYTPSPVNAWASAGSTIVSLPDNSGTGCSCVPELGPAVLRPDGTVLATGATLHNALYDTNTGLWSATQDFPVNGGDQMVAADAPAVLLRGGHVLVSTSKFFSGPSHLYDFDGSNWNPVPDPSNNGNASYQTRMLLLPTGQVLFTDNSSDLEIYTPSGAADAYATAWQPTITTAPSIVTAGNTYTISGTQFNGLSQANAYGDDTQDATNYPLIRVTNHATGHVVYARTHDHSTMGVATGSAIVSTMFDAPSGLESGPSDLVVVANGIPSSAIVINGPDLTITKSHTDPFTQGDGGDTFTLTVKNVGGDATSGTVTVTDALPGPFTATGLSGAGWTCNLGTLTCTRADALSAGSSYGPITLTVNVANNAPIFVTNKATVSGGGEASNVTANDVASDTATVRQHTTTTVQAATQDYDDVVMLTATVSPSGVSGSVEFFVNGSSVGVGAYDSGTGVATIAYLVALPAGSDSLKAAFTSANPIYLDSSATLPTGLTVTREQTTLSYTGDTVIANGGTATMSGTLLEDGVKPIAGRTVTFTLGSGVTQQSCGAVSNANGVATCAISPVAQPLGPGVVADAFAGDAFYLPASANATTILFAFLTSGADVVGDGNAAIGTGVTFWGADWSSLNSLGGGPASPSFKGFASTLTAEPPSCHMTWTTRSGNSSNPPSSVPAYMGVIVSTTVAKSGSTISGDVLSIVVVQTNAGYEEDPGHAGTGVIIAQFCHR
jgi:hypothetical protein